MKRVQHYQVRDRLFAGEYPGSFAAEITADRLQELISKGVRTFIDLTTAVDRLEPYEPAFAEFKDVDLRRFSHEIPDLSIPSTPDVMHRILDRIRTELEADRGCYVHCWAGIGRTGTVVGCWLKESGMDSLAALDEVQRRYFAGMEKSAIHPRSPQTPVQVRYVRNWPDV